MPQQAQARLVSVVPTLPDLPDDHLPRSAGWVDARTHRFRHHFSRTWLDRGGSERD
jgi:hypothetical protein